MASGRNLRIGAVDGEGPDMFGQIAEVAFGPSAEILVLDPQAEEVRTFDGQGRHVRTVGGSGGGPGEFSGAFGLDWNAEDQLWVAEIGNDRYSVFDSSGTYLVSYRRSLPGVVCRWQGGFGADGRLYHVIGQGGPGR